MLARPDGTDLRTGSVSLAGSKAVAATRAPVRLIESPIHLIAIGGMEDREGRHRPWRVFQVEVEVVDSDYDVGDSMALGFGQLRASRMRVHAEQTLDEALGFSIEERAGRVLGRIQQLRQTPWFMAPDRVLGDADLAALAHRPDAVPPREIARVESLDQAREWIARIIDRHDRHWGITNQEFFGRLTDELAKVREDAANLAAASALCATALDELAELAAEIDHGTPEALSKLALLPSQYLIGHFSWQLVDPILAAPPTPLVDPFAGFAELVLRGCIPLGWCDGALAIFAGPAQSRR